MNVGDLTEHPSPPSAAGSTDYQQTIRVHASPGKLFDALTTAAGLTAWWDRATGSGDTGGELRFQMNAPEPLVIQVDEAARPTSVRWTVTECSFLPDWIGTQPVFTITAVDGGESDLCFRHHGLNSALDCSEMCSASWNHFMTSLRDYVETGRGSPRGSAADEAWRAKRRAGQTAQTTPSAATEKEPAMSDNIEIITRFEHEFRAASQATIDELCHPDLVDHNPAPGEEPTLAGFKRKVAGFRATFPDLVDDLQDIVASGDTVATRWVVSGSMQQDFMGVVAVGQPVRVEGMNFYRLKDGRVTDIWAQFDGVALMQQLAAVPA
jgi:predicted ester cyclase/uncharacterized protein YndB with AHSA1/START domain